MLLGRLDLAAADDRIGEVERLDSDLVELDTACFAMYISCTGDTIAELAPFDVSLATSL